ncbi:hypothetical protein CGUJ_03165 [Candidatus Liberibacter asiaticus str. Ishi-1]|nr:hypothetical protein CGUJ_03165 [Candidatus Liberibacter asiaticus str. Ishi-1]
MLSSWIRISTFSKSSIDLLDFEPMIMKKFILSDYSKDRVKYSLVAERAKTSFNSGKGIIFLQDFELTVPTQRSEYGDMYLFAHSARFNLANHTLYISQPFKMKVKDNLRLDFETAVLDVKNITINSSDPVIITHSDFVLSANFARIENSSRSAVFAGQVSVVVNPGVLQKKEN